MFRVQAYGLRVQGCSPSRRILLRSHRALHWFAFRTLDSGLVGSCGDWILRHLLTPIRCNAQGERYTKWSKHCLQPQYSLGGFRTPHLSFQGIFPSRSWATHTSLCQALPQRAKDRNAAVQLPSMVPDFCTSYLLVLVRE